MRFFLLPGGKVNRRVWFCNFMVGLWSSRPRIVNDVLIVFAKISFVARRSLHENFYVTRINDGCCFSWQAQYLMFLECVFLWHPQHLVILECLLFVVGAVFGNLGR